MSLTKYATPLEQRIAAKIVDDALALGYSIDVFDGEETTLRASKDRDAILGAMASTGQDYLRFIRDGGERVGWVCLIWGNDCALISDASASKRMNALLKGAEAIAESEG